MDKRGFAVMLTYRPFPGHDCRQALDIGFLPLESARRGPGA